MIEFFEWMRGKPFAGRTWLICGKGPTFDRHTEVKDIDTAYVTFGLNHVCRTRRMNVSHIIDANVLDEIDCIPDRMEYLVMPWHPHFKFIATPKTLIELSSEKPVLQELASKGRLLWYNLSSWPKPHDASPVVKVGWFSAEAAVGLLAMSGVKQIRTLGIDGGNKYAEAFKDISPFRGGHTTFDHQNKPIEDTVKKYCLDYGPLV